MTETVRMAEPAWPALGDRHADGAPGFLPCGSFEQHGPHLPTSVDMLVGTDGNLGGRGGHEGAVFA